MRPRIAGVGLTTLAAATIALAGPIALAAPAHAAAGERVVSNDIAVQVQRSGLVSITETINYDFGDQSKHGIFRYIPDKFRHDHDHDRVYPITVTSATQDGQPVHKSVKQKDASTVIQLGDPNRKIHDKHTYVLKYTVDRSLNRVDGGPQLYYNAVGSGWEVPIDDVTVTVTAPGRIGRLACYVGSGSQDPCNSKSTSGRGATTATFKQGELAAHSGLTVVAALPDTVATPAVKLAKRTDFGYRMAGASWSVWGLAAAALAGLVGTAALVFARGRDRRFVGQVPGLRPAAGQDASESFRPMLASPEGPVEFVPPRGVRPGSVGVLLKQDTTVRDVTATIVDLAVRGYLRMEEKDGGKDWLLSQLREPDAALTGYERTLLGHLFNGRSEVLISDLRNTFARTTKTVRSQIMDDAVDQQWYARRPDLVRGIWAGRALGVVVLGVLVGLITAFAFDAGLVGVGVAIAGVLLGIAARWMPTRTAIGSAAYAQALGFRRYIRVAEARQLKEEEREGVFSRYLPYAIAFNEADRWVKTFSAVNAVNPEAMSGWYVGSGQFTAVYFAASMSSFTTTAGSSIVSTPSASGGSGFGGGGFSGGGFGGGGGGSW